MSLPTEEKILSRDELFIKMTISAWDTYNDRVTRLLDKLSDDELGNATAPGRNSGTYLIGHLVAISDALLPILGYGERMYPELDEAFVDNPDRSGKNMPPVSTLREYWTKVNDRLAQHIRATSVNEWFTRHSRVSEEDFAREPHRNKLNILINRTNHTSYHFGQLIYLLKKE